MTDEKESIEHEKELLYLRDTPLASLCHVGNDQVDRKQHLAKLDEANHIEVLRNNILTS